MRCIFLTISVLLSVLSSTAQESSIISAPVDIPTEGWNKTVKINDGNTLLFHFQLRKLITIKIFDKDGKEIATKRPDLKLIDVNQLDNAKFEGLYSINNEAVLFVTQHVDNLRTLIRARFNSNTGALISEERLVKSPSFTKETIAKVLKNANEPGYYVSCYTHTKLDTLTDIKIIIYNEKHEVETDIPYLLNSRDYDFVRLLNSGIDRTGSILICTELSKIIQYPDLYQRTLMMFYVQKGEKKFITNKIMLPERLNIGTTEFTVNSFAGKLNVFIDKIWDATYNTGGREVKAEYVVQSLFIVPDDLSGLKEAGLRFDTANAALGIARKDTTLRYVGTILNRYTNVSGKTTVIYEDDKNIDEKTLLKNGRTVCAADICVAQYDDDGKEMWSSILPKSHYYAPVTVPLYVFAKSSSDELYATSCLSTKKCHYVLFNDPDENFNKTLADPAKQLWEYNNTNAVYYHIDKKNKVERKYLFKKPEQGEYLQFFPGSVYFDEPQNVVVSLVQRNKDKKQTLHVAWAKLAE